MITVGDNILASDGRVGVVTETRLDDGGIFARPADVPYKVADKHGVTGVSGAVLIMATVWYIEADGTLTGRWADSRLNTKLTARLI